MHLAPPSRRQQRPALACNATCPATSIDLTTGSNWGAVIEQSELQLWCAGPVAVGGRHVYTHGDEAAGDRQRQGRRRFKLHIARARIVGGIGRHGEIGRGGGLALEGAKRLCQLLGDIPGLLGATAGRLAIRSRNRLVCR